MNNPHALLQKGARHGEPILGYPTLPRRLRVLLITLVTLSVVLIATTFEIAWHYRGSTQWVEHSHLVMEKLADLLSTVRDAQIQERGYLRTGQQTFLSPFLAANNSLDQQLRELRELTSGTPRQRQNLDRLATVLKKRLTEMSEAVRSRRPPALNTIPAFAFGSAEYVSTAALRKEGERMRTDLKD